VAGQKLVVKYAGGWMGPGTPQRGKSVLWVENGSLRFRVLSGCLPLQLLFMRKFDIPVSEIQRVEVESGQHRGSVVHLYTEKLGIVAFGFPYQRGPQAKAMVESLLRQP
jgi:hypothetical protein